MNFYVPPENPTPEPAYTKPDVGYKWWMPPQRQEPKQPQMIVKGPDTAIHFVLTVLTCGLWLPIWIIAAITGKRTITYRD